MDTNVMFAIVLAVLAIVVIGGALLFRSRREGRMESSADQTSSGFKDCYDLCAHDPGQGASQACSTMCCPHGGA